MAKRTDLTGAALFRETTLEQWQALLHENDIHDIEVHHDKSQIKVRCIHPDHNDSSPSAWINTEYGNYHCWSCSNDTVFDPIKVVSLITGDEYGEAYETFTEFFGLMPGKKAASQAFADSQETRRRLNAMVSLTRYALRKVSADYDNSQEEGYREAYYKPVRWLRQRGITHADLDIFNIGVLLDPIDMSRLATDYYFKAGKPLDQVSALIEDYKTYFGKVMRIDNFGALLFPHYISPSDVGRIQIRNDFLRPGETKLKFYFVDAGESAPANIKAMFDRPTGFYALDTWQSQRKNTGFAIAVTEGATDTFANYKAQLDEFGRVTLPSIAVPGMGAKEMDRLVSYGIQEVRFLQDHPRHRGDTVVNNYIKHSSKLDIMPLIWPEEMLTKDIAKLYQDQGGEAVCDLVLTESNYVKTPAFMLSQMKARVEAEGAGPERISRLAEEYIQQIGSPSAQREFLHQTELHFECVSSRQLENNIAIEDDTIEGFLLRLRRDILSEFDFLYKAVDYDENKTIIALRNRRNGKKFLSPLNSNALIDMVSEAFKSRTEWAHTAQMPTSMRFKKSGKQKTPVSPLVLRREMGASIRDALEAIAFDVAEMKDPFADLSQGVHRIEEGGEEKILVVNGNDRYIGTFEGNSKANATVRWQTYCEEMVVLQDHPKWTEHIQHIGDLDAGNSVDMAKVYQTLHAVINTGWEFVDQKADATWLTALSLYSAIYDFSDRTLFTVVTGERSSGKSKLVKDFFAGERPFGSRMPGLDFYNYKEFPSTTEAGIRQEYAGPEGIRRQGLVLDEFENDGPKSLSKMEAMFGTFRGMLDGVAKVTKGSKTGHKVTYNLRFPVITSGILEFTDPTGAVESRVYRVTTKHNPARRSPSATIGRKMPSLDGDALSKKITVGMFRYAIAAREEARKIIDRINSSGYCREPGVDYDDRTVVAAGTIGGILRVCGFSFDEVEKAIVPILRKLSETKEVTQELPGDKIWNDLLSMVVPLPEKPDSSEFDMFGPARHQYNRVSLHDALHDSFLRQFIGKTDFFQAFNIYEEEFLLIDRYYLRKYLKEEGMNWSKFCTLMGRCFEVTTQEEARTIASRNGDSRFRRSSKQILCMRLPAEILFAWDDAATSKPKKGGGHGPPDSRGNHAGRDSNPAPSGPTPPSPPAPKKEDGAEGSGGSGAPETSVDDEIRQLYPDGDAVPPDRGARGGDERVGPADGRTPLVAKDSGEGDSGPSDPVPKENPDAAQDSDGDSS